MKLSFGMRGQESEPYKRGPSLPMSVGMYGKSKETGLSYGVREDDTVAGRTRVGDTNRPGEDRKADRVSELRGATK
jgi:hypothetical protein